MIVPFRTPEGLIDLLNLRPRDVGARYLGDALAKVNRYSGRTREPFSVAAHSVIVSRLCPPDHRAWGLLHDAHEAFLGDITTPAVDVLGRIDARVPAAIAGAKATIDRAILAAWAVQPVFARAVVQRLDRTALQAEMYVLMDAEVAISRETADDFDRAVTLVTEQRGGDWRAARELWIAEARHLANLGLLTLPPDDHDHDPGI